MLTAVDARTPDCRLCTVLGEICDVPAKGSFLRPVKAAKVLLLVEEHTGKVVKDFCTTTPALCRAAMHAMLTLYEQQGCRREHLLNSLCVRDALADFSTNVLETIWALRRLS